MFSYVFLGSCNTCPWMNKVSFQVMNLPKECPCWFWDLQIKKIILRSQNWIRFCLSFPLFLIKAFLHNDICPKVLQYDGHTLAAVKLIYRNQWWFVIRKEKIKMVRTSLQVRFYQSTQSLINVIHLWTIPSFMVRIAASRNSGLSQNYVSLKLFLHRLKVILGH